MDAPSQFRSLPKIDRLLEDPSLGALIAEHGRDQVLGAVRSAVDEARQAIARGVACPTEAQIVDAASETLRRDRQPTLRPVINATGVIIHTNLGRVPLSEEAIAAMGRAARGYSNLELDLDSGERGSRYVHCGRLLSRLTGAEDGLVVNNNAAGVMLILAALARGREVVVSRGQLVEIGGGFRIPDVMRESGAQLVEVGTTNRTYASDYETAISERTAALMLVHRSNFQLTGFVHEPAIEELHVAAAKHGVLLLDDLGSGTLLDTTAFGLSHEPTVKERITAGADLVAFSGDKLLGGPQAGFIVGKKNLVERLRRFPMTRALRVDKVTLAGIEATLRHYLRGDALERIPVWRAIAATTDQLDARARAWKQALGSRAGLARVVDAVSTVGGGALPGKTLPTRALAVSVPSLQAVARRLRFASWPVVCRIEAEALVFDPRTVQPEEDSRLVESLSAVLPEDAPAAG
jgi:L-seryl-tRNA(Ser) seleniumtransferase